MAYIRLSFASEKLHGNTDISVFLPSKKRPRGMGGFRKIPKASYDKDEVYQVLWLIHGGGDDYTAWPLDAMIQRACDAAELVVIMPTILDLPGIRKDMDTVGFVTEELPEAMSFMFPISRRRQDNFIAGLSYGGYFSYRCAMLHPELYACVGSFSSPLDVAEDVRRLHANDPAFVTDEITGSDRDILYLTAKLKEEGREMPKTFQTVGTEDFTWDFNVTARDHFVKLGMDHTFIQRPGTHNFEFWDGALKDYLEWLPLVKSPVRKERF
ncbi:MAG: hypothetical protein IJL98_05110 [Lachnospiraceae bacterium]|nr:hypothetical protein [Lachnospiraceae bacterium]